MKRIIFLFTFVLLIISCENAKIEPNPEIPNWLKDRIAQDEETLKSNPKSALNVSAWIRYIYDGIYYFEFVNLLSSMGPHIYMQDGTTFLYTDKNFSKYQSEKCCKLYIWKGPSYFEIND